MIVLVEVKVGKSTFIIPQTKISLCREESPLTL